MRDPDLGLTYYEYDLLDRVIAVKNPAGEVTYYDYNLGGQVKTRKLGNHALVYYTYDPARRVTRIQHRTSGLAEIATLNYQYDHVGNPVSIIREDGSATYFSYDSIYQLTAETQLDSGGDPTYQAEYQYDGAHNRTVKVIDGAPSYYTYNEANQLETEKTAAGTTYYHHDGCGNTTAKQAAGGTTYLQYNTENLLTRIDFPAGGGHSYYTYDGDSKRVSQRTADGYTGFVYQGPDMLALQLERNEAGTTQAHYTIGQGLESVRRSGVSHFYHYNHLGTTIALTASNQTVSDTYKHDAWGVQLSSSGSTVNPHTYVGRERYYRMANADLYHLGFRDYDQALGRFMTVDPERQGLNWYVYVNSRAATASDPRGEYPSRAGRADAPCKVYFWIGDISQNWFSDIFIAQGLIQAAGHSAEMLISLKRGTRSYSNSTEERKTFWPTIRTLAWSA